MTSQAVHLYDHASDPPTESALENEIQSAATLLSPSGGIHTQPIASPLHLRKLPQKQRNKAEDADAEAEAAEENKQIGAFSSADHDHVDHINQLLTIGGAARLGDEQMRMEYKPVSNQKTGNEQLAILYAMPRSIEASQQLIELCTNAANWDAIANLLLLRDTFEPFAVNINYQDPSNGQTALHRICEHGCLDILQLLYECSNSWMSDTSGLQLDIQDFQGLTPLMLACQSGHLMIVKFLLETLHASAELRDPDGWTAFMYACSRGHWHIVEYLVTIWQVDVNDTSNRADTPLMLAGNNGYLNVVRFLVEHTDAGLLPPPPPVPKPKAEDDEQNEEDQEQEHEPIDSPEEPSLNKITGLEQENVLHWTALISAVHYGQVYVVHYLVSKGANPDRITAAGINARTVPLSALALQRSTHVTREQVDGALQQGLVDRLAPPDSSRKVALQAAILRYKRACRYMHDAEQMDEAGQFEASYLLYCCAYQATKEKKILAEEGLIRSAASDRMRAMAELKEGLTASRHNTLKSSLDEEAKRHMLLAKKYMEESQWTTAIQCLNVCVRLDPENEAYSKLLVKANRQHAAALQHRDSTSSMNSQSQSQTLLRSRKMESSSNSQRERKACMRSCW